MRIWTYGQVRAKVELDTDIQDESFITYDELVGYANEAIAEAEAEIHDTGREYFLQKAYLSIVSGTAEYDLPTDIYANRIRAIIYDDGSRIYEIKRIRQLNKFLEIHLLRQNGTTLSDSMQYFIEHNSASTGFKITLAPTPNFTSSTRVRVWFERDANRVPLSSEGSETASDATKIDIPEFVAFVIAFMKERVLAKEERGSPSHQDAKIELEKQRQQMVSTLTEQFVDDKNEVEQDLSVYWEHS